MVRRRRFLNFSVLVVLVAAGVYFASRYWSKAADSIPATTVLTGATTTLSGSAPTTGTKSGAVQASGGSPSSATGAGAPTAQDALAAAKLQQAQAESRELDQLQALAKDPSANATVRAQAAEQVVQLEQFQEEESLAEVVLAAKGFPGAVVMLQAGGATVLVAKGPFDAPKAAMVAQAVASIAGMDPSQVQIVPTA